jgi:hypothetical protein
MFFFYRQVYDNKKTYIEVWVDNILGILIHHHNHYLYLQLGKAGKGCKDSYCFNNKSIQNKDKTNIFKLYIIIVNIFTFKLFLILFFNLISD